jgi:hypothetical protein
MLTDLTPLTLDTVVVYFVATMIKLKVSIDKLSKSGLSRLTLITDLNYLSPILAVFIRDGAFFFFM